MSAAKYGGTLVGGAGLAALAGHLGWPAAYLAAALLLLLPAAAVLALDEPARPPPAGRGLLELLRQLPPSFLRRTTGMTALFVLIAGASDSFLYPLVVSKLRLGLGLSDARMTALASLAVGTSIAGSLAGGWLADRLGRRRAVLVGAVGLAAAHLAFAAIRPSVSTLIAYQIGGGLAAGVLYATTLALCMDVTNPKIAATHFQFFMALLNVRSVWASMAGGHAAERLTPVTMFLLAAGLELLPLALLPFIDPGRAKAVSSST
jgi:MFS family permease